MKKSFLVFASALLISCGNVPVSDGFVEAPLPKSEAALHFKENLSAISSLDTFYDYSREILPRKEGENFLYSPVSYYMSLCFLSTFEGMVTPSILTPMGTSGIDDIVSLGQQIAEGVQWASDNIVSARMTNLAIDFDHYYGEKQKEIFVNQFHASFLSDYSKKDQYLNSWISKLTDGNVKEMKGDTFEEGSFGFITGLYLNAVYLGGGFCSTFDGKFNETEEALFQKGDMCLRELTINDDYNAISIGLSFGRLGKGQARILMPKKESLSSFLKGKALRSFFEGGDGGYHTALTMPKQIITDSLDLGECTKDMGFISSDKVALPAITQDSHLEFKEDGVYGYSLTQAPMIATSIPNHEVTIDRPYAFEILDPNGVTLFYGEAQTTK